MKYTYRDITVFEYINGDVIQHNIDGAPAFDCCRWNAEACKELAEFFDKVARDMSKSKPIKTNTSDLANINNSQ